MFRYDYIDGLFFRFNRMNVLSLMTCDFELHWAYWHNVLKVDHGIPQDSVENMIFLQGASISKEAVFSGKFQIYTLWRTKIRTGFFLRYVLELVELKVWRSNICLRKMHKEVWLFKKFKYF